MIAKEILLLMRPHQYTKNLIIFLPSFFAFQLNNSTVIVQAIIGFLIFSLTASAVYIFNDWRDRHEDAQHPEKKHRPIASGKLSANLALLIALGLIALALGLTLSWQVTLIIPVGLYLILNIAYSLGLKHIPIIDISIISIGFVIRLFVGAMITNIELSHWIIVMTFLLALFLSLAKRRDDVLIFLNTKQKMRPVIDGYNLKFLDAAMMMSASIVILAYILWSISPEVTAKLQSTNLYLTSVFVVLGILRYMQITFVEEKSGNPSKLLLKDLSLKLTILCWGLSFLWILYI